MVTHFKRQEGKIIKAMCDMQQGDLVTVGGYVADLLDDVTCDRCKNLLRDPEEVMG